MAFGRFYYGVLGPLSLLGPSPFWTLFIKEPDAIYREPDAIYFKKQNMCNFESFEVS